MNGADADTAVDRKRARFDDALLEAPALHSRILEVEVGKIDFMRMDRCENARKMAVVEPGGLEQEAARLGDQRSGGAGKGQIGHGILS
jgi:hypothetical protein